MNMENCKGVKIIARPDNKGGYLDFWKFERYTGQDKGQYDYIFTYHKSLSSTVKDNLKRYKKQYLQMIQDVMNAKRVIMYQDTKRKARLYESVRREMVQQQQTTTGL